MITVMKKLIKVAFLFCATLLILMLINLSCTSGELSVPILLSPLHNSTIVQNPPTFIWQNVNGFDSYWLQVSQNSSFVSSVINVSGLTDTSYTPSHSLNSGLYYWHVGVSEDC